MNDHEKHIRSLLATYERSLNTSDTALAASCYTVNAPTDMRRKLPGMRHLPVGRTGSNPDPRNNESA